MNYREFMLDTHGRLLDDTSQRNIEAMSQPVRCRCGGVYDLGTVEVTARYADCSMWKAWLWHTSRCTRYCPDVHDRLV
jgi:hypothetical protein